MIKVFPRMELKGCLQCPYFSEEYESCKPDWFQCNHPKTEIYNGKIMDEWDWSGHSNTRRLNLKTDNIPFPEKCPLKTKRRTK